MNKRKHIKNRYRRIRINPTFGVPKFNSLFDFFTKAVDYRDSVLVNTVRKPYTTSVQTVDIYV